MRISFVRVSDDSSRTAVFGALGGKMVGVLLGASSRRGPGRIHPPPAHPALPRRAPPLPARAARFAAVRRPAPSRPWCVRVFDSTNYKPNKITFNCPPARSRERPCSALVNRLLTVCQQPVCHMFVFTWGFLLVVCRMVTWGFHMFVLQRNRPGQLLTILGVENERLCPGRTAPPLLCPAPPRPAPPHPAWPCPAPTRPASPCSEPPRPACGISAFWIRQAQDRYPNDLMRLCFHRDVRIVIFGNFDAGRRNRLIIGRTEISQ